MQLKSQQFTLLFSSISLISLKPDNFFINLFGDEDSVGDKGGLFSTFGNVGKKFGIVKSKIGQPTGIDTPENFCEKMVE